MPLQIHYPVKPFNITQHWNNPNPAYSQQFNDPSFKNHNGVDFISVAAQADGSFKKQTEWPIYWPVEGFKVWQVRWAPEGGGNEIWFVSNKKMMVDGTLCYVFLVMCHAKKIFVQAGYEPALGELVMIADNTGFSTGPHTHFGMYRSSEQGWVSKIDTNEATGSYDIEKFFSGKYASELASRGTLLSNAFRYYNYVLRG